MKSEYTEFEEQIHIDTFRHDASWRMRHMHYHSSYEILLVDDGGFNVLIDDRIYTGYKYDIFTISPYMAHKNNGGMDHQRTAVNFPTEYLKKYFTPRAISRLLKCFSSEMHTLTEDDFCFVASELARLGKDPDEFYRLANVLERIESSGEPQSRLKATNGNSKYSNEITEYINRRYNRSLTLAELSDRLCASREHLCRVFRAETGMTIGDYLSKVRIMHACDLLRTTDSKITEIAMAVGYESLGYFNRVFKKETGMTPSEFIKSDGESHD